MGDRLTGKVAVITGASSGIGAASARRFVEEGAKVVVADVQTDLGEQVVSELGDAARFAQCDVTDEAAIAAAIDLATSTWGRLDVMFNNAGVVGAVGPVADTEAAAWARTIDILLTSVFYGCKHAARVMVPQGSGSIISTSSAAGILGGLGPHAYTAVEGRGDRAHQVGGRGAGAAGCSLQCDRPGRHTDGTHRARHVRRRQRPRRRGRVVEAALRKGQ